MKRKVVSPFLETWDMDVSWLAYSEQANHFVFQTLLALRQRDSAVRAQGGTTSCKSVYE